MQKRGRPTKKVENLRRFTKQWEEFTDDPQALVKFNDEDASYIEGALQWDSDTLDGFNGMANALQGEM